MLNIPNVDDAIGFILDLAGHENENFVLVMKAKGLVSLRDIKGKALGWAAEIATHKKFAGSVDYLTSRGVWRVPYAEWCSLIRSRTLRRQQRRSTGAGGISTCLVTAVGSAV
jgi:hypothetical protein